MKIHYALALSLLLLTPPMSAEAKQPPLTEEERTIIQVFAAEDASKEAIFQAAKMWIAENFKSAKSVIEYEDADSGTIVGNGSIAYPCTGGWTCRVRAESWRVTFTMKVEAKNGRFRLSFTNVLMSYPPYNNMGVSRPAYDEPVSSREDMTNIRAKLMAFGPEIVASAGRLGSDENW